MQGFDIDVRNRVTALVKAILDQNSVSAGFDADSRLVDVGLTSMDMVSLMLAVEAEFDLMIPSTDITPQNFRSIAAIDALVSRLGGSAA